MTKPEPDWKEIALQLAQRVNFAMANLKGTGGLLNTETMKFTSWRDYMIEGMEMIPGVKVDREVAATLDMPPAKRKKAQLEIKARKEQEKANDHTI